MPTKLISIKLILITFFKLKFKCSILWFLCCLINNVFDVIHIPLLKPVSNFEKWKLWVEIFYLFLFHYKNFWVGFSLRKTENSLSRLLWKIWSEVVWDVLQSTSKLNGSWRRVQYTKYKMGTDYRVTLESKMYVVLCRVNLHNYLKNQAASTALFASLKCVKFVVLKCIVEK